MVFGGCFCSQRQRPRRGFRVALTRDGESDRYGFVATFAPNGPKDQGLVIRDITQDMCTAASRWNAAHVGRGARGVAECQIRAGQVILEVNGQTETPEMLREVSDANTLEMLISDQLTPLQKEIFRVSRKKSRMMAKLENILQDVPRSVREDLGEACSICFDDMDEKSTAVQLPCGHCFHKKCVTKWLTSGEPRQRCPLCNQKLEISP